MHFQAFASCNKSRVATDVSSTFPFFISGRVTKISRVWKGTHAMVFCQRVFEKQTLPSSVAHPFCVGSRVTSRELILGKRRKDVGVVFAAQLGTPTPTLFCTINNIGISFFFFSMMFCSFHVSVVIPSITTCTRGQFLDVSDINVAHFRKIPSKKWRHVTNCPFEPFKRLHRQNVCLGSCFPRFSFARAKTSSAFRKAGRGLVTFPKVSRFPQIEATFAFRAPPSHIATSNGLKVRLGARAL